MKKFILVISFLLILKVNAQGLEQVGWVSKFGIAVGFTPVYFLPDLSPMKQMLENFGTGGLANGGLLGYGGGGYAYVMLVKNLRIGGYGFSAATQVSNVVNGLKREAEFSYGGGAFTIEYTLPSVKKVGISFGAMIGGVSAELTLTQLNKDFNWSNLWNEFDNKNFSSRNITHKLSNSGLIIAPIFNVDIPFNRFMAFRIGGGYLVSFSSDWKVDDRYNIADVPPGLKSDSFFVELGLFAGFFVY